MRTDSSWSARLGWLARAAFWLAIALAVADALLPDELHVRPPWDKFGHFTVFYGAMVLALAAFPRIRPPWLMLGLVMCGAGIELGQAIPMLHRDAEWADLVADAAGALAAVLPTLAWKIRQAARPA